MAARAGQPDSSPLVPFGPLIAAVVVAVLAGGTQEVRALLGRMTRWRVHPAWCPVVVLAPFVADAVAGGLAVAAGAPHPRAEAYPDLLTIGGTLLSTIAIVGLFEEVGWRGFALPRLQRHHDALSAALMLGVIWALWHLPELISDPTGQRPPVQFVLCVIAQSVIFTWLYNRTNGSLPIVILFHAAINTAGRLMLQSFPEDQWETAWWARVATYGIVAVTVTIHGGKTLTTANPRQALPAERVTHPTP